MVQAYLSNTEGFLFLLWFAYKRENGKREVNKLVYQVEIKEIQHIGQITDAVNRETARATSASHQILSLYLVMKNNQEVGLSLLKESRSGVREIDFFGKHEDMWHVISIVKEMNGELKSEPRPH